MNIDDFPIEIDDQITKDKYLPFLKALESQFKCAGMCSEQKSFMFSDVNYGPPQGTCKDEMLQFIEGNSLYLAVFLLTIGIAGLVSFGASFGV